MASSTRSTRCTTVAGAGRIDADVNSRPRITCTRRRAPSSNRRYDGARRYSSSKPLTGAISAAGNFAAVNSSSILTSSDASQSRAPSLIVRCDCGPPNTSASNCRATFWRAASIRANVAGQSGNPMFTPSRARSRDSTGSE